MQRGEGGSHSIGMDTNMPGFFPLPFTLGEAMDNYVYAPVANSDEFWRMRGIRDFKPGTPYTQISSTQAPDHIMDAIPLPGTFAYPVPSECPKNAITDNSSNPSDSLFNHCFEGLPFTTTGSNRSDQCSEISSSDPIGYALHKRQSEHVSSSSSNLSLSFDSRHNPLHLSSLLSGSRFFHAMEEILAEIACYALENFDGKFYSSTGINNNNEGVGETDGDQKILLVEAKKKNLLALLQMVDERYNQCLDEIHTVISAFYAVTELDPNLHARFALPTISFMYKNLRERISSHILAMGSHLSGGDDASRGEDNTLESCFLQNQWALQQLRKRSDHQLWRPQRGLPERSVSVLRAWMFQNFLHPYPKDAEKHLLALRSGLTRNQVSNWFINARVRLWKPMIEEMYSEMNRRKVRRNDEEDDMHVRNHLRFENARFTMD